MFQNDSLTLTPAAALQHEQNAAAQDKLPGSRYRPWNDRVRNEKSIYDLYSAEIQFKIDAAEEIRLQGAAAPAIALLQSNTSPVDRINALLMQGNLEVRIVVDHGELKAKRGEHVFSLAKMSDGERSAVVLASEIITAAPSTIFIIDEPERHLHRAIVVPLIAGLVAERPDCGFLISTHELDAPLHSEEAGIVLVRSCIWNGEQVSTWDVDVLLSTDTIPESLRVDLYGSRRTLLFVEGQSTSLDQPLYSLLFPEVSVRAKEACTEVIRAVNGLRGCQDVHHVTAFGLVDGDGMADDRIAALEGQGIYPLPFYSVESLFYSKEVVEAIAGRQAETLGANAVELKDQAYGEAVASITQEQKQHLAGRISERELRDSLLSQLPRERDLVEGGNHNISVELPSPYPDELALLEGHVGASDLDALVARYPVRESGVLGAIAQGLHFNNRADYEKAVLSKVAADDGLRQVLIAKLGRLAAELQNGN
ncbi:MAG: ATP-binding protein [Alphaproteobacteria bacterium]|nr:ATP-binding protein [Alphaproteobacteria bacterium]